jgi:hypothetical protein
MKKVLDKAFQLLTPKKDQEFFYSFLPKTNKEFFDDSPGVNKDEKIKNSNAYQYTLTGSINTTLIDGFRQGVEITRAKHFFSGNSGKIHAGEPGHVLRKNYFGTDRNFLKQNYYVELEYYNPVSYLNAGQFITYPLVTYDSDETENYNFNGVIEPLTIRAVAALFSIDVPFEAHSCKGLLMGGNHDITMSSDRILTVDVRKTNHKIQPWLDLIEMVGTVKKIPTLPFFNDDKSHLNPFNDLANKVQLSTNLPDDMKSAVASLIGSTENYVSENDISATCGWTYDDVTIKGTDSIAFGGLGY